jgi:recombination protein RecR
MPAYTPRLQRLIDALRRLPGVGPKSAQRMAFHLLDRDRDGASYLATALSEALTGIARCPRCRMFCEEQACHYCGESRRAAGQLCIVESPADLLAIESAAGYRGRYFVLMGKLSPLDGIGPKQLGFDLLNEQLADGSVQELIVAINPSVEGEATAYALAELARRHGVKVTRLAQGVPMGGELESIDSGTLSRALTGRQSL